MRNGSGIPINTAGKLDPVLREFMTDAAYDPYREQGLHVHREDPADEAGLLRPAPRHQDARCVALFGTAGHAGGRGLDSRRRTAEEENLYYNNKIMNYFGDSFHVTDAGLQLHWTYETYEDATKAGKPDRGW